MKIETKKLSELKPADWNPRKISESALAGLKASIKKYGLVEPIVYNKRTGNVVGGHQRLKVLLDLGETETDVIVVDLPEIEEKALNVTLNNPSITGAFTNDLQVVLEEIKINFEDMSNGLEFDFKELKLDELYNPEHEGKSNPDNIPQVSDPVCKPGQLWELGNHRILCGNSTNAQDIERLIGEQKVDAILTDPPYGLGQAGVPHDSPQENEALINNAVELFPIVDGVIVAFQSTRTFPTYLDAIRRNGIKFERILSLYNEAQCTYPWRGWILKTESILVASKGNPKWQDVHPYQHDAYKVSEVSHEIPDSIGWHGSIKPQSVLIDLVQRICPINSIVFDGFLGSGSTLIACERTERKCYGIEIDENNCDLILKRWEDFMNQKPVLLSAK